MDKSLKVLLIEDSEDDALLILRELRKGGYIVAPARVETESAMREALSSQKWDVILSDYHLPGFSGLEALSIFKKERHRNTFHHNLWSYWRGKCSATYERWGI